MAVSIEKVVFPAASNKKLRVCAYARVSMDDEGMWHSLNNQIRFYTQQIQNNPEWEFAGVFWDKPTTGTKDSRPQFQLMLQKCRNGEIDMIIVKSISRFVRNTLILISLLRELKSIGVDVYFEKENMHSTSGECELMLTLYGAVAQEESRSVSENCKWQIKKRFQQGIMTPCYILGYDFKDNTLVINKKEAKTVVKIFEMYLSGMGTLAIANELNAGQIRTKYGKEFTNAGVRKIIENEKYVGDALLQKYYVSDHLTKTLRRNKGELDSYFVSEHHEGIIDRDTFDRVQELIRINEQRYKHPTELPVYPLTSKIKCGICGKNYRRKTTHGGVVYVCTTYNTKGKAACPSKAIPEPTLHSVIAELLGTEDFDEEIFSVSIDFIEAFNGNKLVFHFKDGRQETVIWKDRSRAESWTPEMKKKARDKKLGKCTDNQSN